MWLWGENIWYTEWTSMYYSYQKPIIIILPVMCMFVWVWVHVWRSSLYLEIYLHLMMNKLHNMKIEFGSSLLHENEKKFKYIYIFRLAYTSYYFWKRLDLKIVLQFISLHCLHHLSLWQFVKKKFHKADGVSEFLWELSMKLAVRHCKDVWHCRLLNEDWIYLHHNSI